MIKPALRDEQIIRSLLDLDFYKFTMGQLIFNKFRDVPVKFVFKNRTKGIRLADTVDVHELSEQLDACQGLRCDNSELHYLRGTNEYQERMFSEPYLDFLRHLHLPDYELTSKSDGSISLEFPGDWSKATYWETLALSIINELHYRSQLRKMSRFERDRLYAQGIMRLNQKIDLLKKYPDIKFTDFGTRRRHAFLWQNYTVQTMKAELPNQMIGTSNVLLAMRLGLTPMGTSAHETYMAMYGIMHGSDQEILASHNQVLQDWWQQYGYGLSIALTDTYGSDFFFRDFLAEQAEKWKGLRHDSGDPLIFGEKAINFYKSHGIDPKEKMIVYSDGLDVETIIKIHEQFRGRILTTFGWGTNLTNDLGLPALSLVVKLLESNGVSTVKLSDNLNKAMGSPEEIERAKRIFGYSNTEAEKCRY
ncbi:MAG: nicotinate phosphoribosyltransferase [Candidatus Buchananbacteria bacterium]|jgi:nicotinate phosphoribosyltransferase